MRGGTTVAVYEDERGAYRIVALDEKNKVLDRAVVPAVADIPSSADRPPLHPDQVKDEPRRHQPDTEKQSQSKNDDEQVDAAKGHRK